MAVSSPTNTVFFRVFILRLMFVCESQMKIATFGKRKMFNAIERKAAATNKNLINILSTNTKKNNVRGFECGEPVSQCKMVVKFHRCLF